jgi:hypothetical protein
MKSERSVDAETGKSIASYAEAAAKLLGVDRADSSPLEIVSAIDRWMNAAQKVGLPKLRADNESPAEADLGDSKNDKDSHANELAYHIGSLWGEQLVRELGWQWASVVFEHRADMEVVGVFSPDRSLAIYPLNFVFHCLADANPVTILKAFEILREGSRVPPLPPCGYENVMDHVH